MYLFKNTKKKKKKNQMARCLWRRQRQYTQDNKHTLCALSVCLGKYNIPRAPIGIGTL